MKTLNVIIYYFKCINREAVTRENMVEPYLLYGVDFTYRYLKPKKVTQCALQTLQIVFFCLFCLLNYDPNYPISKIVLFLKSFLI